MRKMGCYRLLLSCSIKHQSSKTKLRQQGMACCFPVPWLFMAWGTHHGCKHCRWIKRANRRICANSWLIMGKGTNSLYKHQCHRDFDRNFRCWTYCKGWSQGSPCVSAHALAAPPVKLPSVGQLPGITISSRFSGSSFSAQPTWVAAALVCTWQVASQASVFFGGGGMAVIHRCYPRKFFIHCSYI